MMTMVIKHSKPSSVTHQTRLGNDEIVMAIDPETKELLYYEDKTDHSHQFISLDKMLLVDNPSLCLHNDKQDCYIDICSPDVLSLFTDNFDYQHLRRHFVKGLLVDDIMGYKIYTHEIHSSYAARVDNFRSYDTISKDIIQRWTYPFVPDVQYFGNCSNMKLDRQGLYKAPGVIQSPSAQVCAFSLVGNKTTIGENSCISNSIIGQGCAIGRNVSIEGSYIWDNVTIEDDCRISYALVCDGVNLRAGVVLEPGTILSYKVEVGQQLVIPAYSKVSLLPQPSRQDSDEELEYADANSGIIESPSIMSMGSGRVDLMPTSSDVQDWDTREISISGSGYIWSACEAGLDEEWRHSIAPIPAEKLNDFFLNAHAEHDESNQDISCFPTSGELPPGSETTGVDDGEEDYRDSADFEKEVEATFLRALAGVDQDNVIIEINSLRLSYNMSHADCAGALFYSIMRSALQAPWSSPRELLENAVKDIVKWKNLLRNYLRSMDEEIEVILKFEEMCLESAKDFSPLFTTILNCLYDKEIVSEDAILSWANEKEGADEDDKTFIRQAEQFITWLREASEEEEDEDDEEAE